MKTTRAIPLALLLALPCASSIARAADLDAARVQFNAGAQAYAAGRYDAAASAFEDAYKLAPKPQILFSLAQAERKRYFAEGKKNPDTLRSAIAHYEQYVKEVKEGARVPDAVDALSELGPLAAKLEPSGGGGTTNAQPSTAAHLTIYSSAEHAKVGIDGAAPVDAPFIGDIAPGKHRVTVSADGYVDATRDVLGEAGGRTTLDVPLEEKPAGLVVESERACDVYLDGRAVGVGPSARPIAVPSGVHVVSFISNGRRIVNKDVTFERGKNEKVTVELERSGQRNISYAFLGTGAASLATGLAAGIVAIVEENKAKSIRDTPGNIGQPDLSDQNSATRQRDAWRTVSIATASAGAALVGTGILLYVFDKPELTQVPPPREKPAGPKKLEVDLAAGPIVTPEGAGLTVVGRF
jgi:hypothetical protein